MPNIVCKNEPALLGALARFGTPDQQDWWAAPAGRGELVLTAALSEEDGDDPRAPSARAERAGDHWLLSGSKTAVPAGPRADLMLVPAGDRNSALALAGAYRPQPGRYGAGLDRAIVRECAMTAIRSFLTQVACALVHPAGTARPTGRSPLPRLLGDKP